MVPSRRKRASQLRRRSKILLVIVGLVLTVATTPNVFAELPRGSISSFALGGTPNLISAGPLDMAINPALASCSTYAVEVLASRLYEMSDFDVAAGAAQYSYRNLSLGLAVNQLVGLDYYAERNLLLAASIAPHRAWRLGVGIEHRRLEFGEGYGTVSIVAASCGLMVRLNEKAAIAVSGLNINRPEFDSDDEPLPLAGQIAATYIANSTLTIVFAHQIEERYPDRFCIGQQVTIVKDVDILIGLTTEPFEISGGLSIKLRGFNFEYAYRNNVYLGGTHRVGLRFSR